MSPTVDAFPTPLAYGPIEIAGHVSSVLWGVLCVQVYLYATRERKDTGTLRLLVATVFFMETLFTVFLWKYYFEETTVRGLGPEWAPQCPWTLILCLAILETNSALVQAFYAYRVRAVSRRLSLAVASWAFIAARLGVSLVVLVLLITQGMIQVMAHYRYTIDITISLTIVVDLWNTGVLCYHLVQAKKAVLKNTSARLSAITTLTLETGLLIFLGAMFMLVAWAASPVLGVWFAAMMIYPRLYSNSLLVSLNSREVASSPSSTAHSASEPSTSGGFAFIRTCDQEVSTLGYVHSKEVSSKPDKASNMSFDDISGEAPFTAHGL